MKKVCLINGSPKGLYSNSYFLLQKVEEKLTTYNKYVIHVVQYNSHGVEMFKNMNCADIIIIAFPLYVYCVPGLLMQFLEDYYEYNNRMALTNKKTRVYIIVNCAFLDPNICNEAIRVLQNFCIRTQLEFRFAVSVGSGGILDTVKKIKVLDNLLINIYLSIEEIIMDIENGTETVANNQYITPNSTKLLEESNSKAKWLKVALKNGLTEKELYKKPYENV